MEVKESTLGAYQNRPVEEPKLTTEPPVTTDVPVTSEAPVTAPEAVTAPPAITAPAAEIIEAEEVEFAMPSFEEAAASHEPATATPPLDWKAALKANREEALKELGLDPFVVELNTHIQNGGKAEDYLQAKAVDWTKVTDSDLLKQQLKSEFPDATQSQIDRLFNKKFTQGDSFEAEDNEDGLLMIGSEARKLRQQRIEQQAKFQIKQAAPVTQTATSSEVSPEAQQAQAQQQQFVNTILNSDTTKNLFQSKVVAIQTGDGRSVNVKFTNPQQLLDVLFDPKVAGKIGRTPQGEPDVQFWLETAAFMANREHYKKMLVGNPKELAKKELVDEGRNAQRHTPVVPLNQQYANYGEAFNSGNIRQTKLGNYTNR
jgi:hypothetical protein